MIKEWFYDNVCQPVQKFYKDITGKTEESSDVHLKLEVDAGLSSGQDITPPTKESDQDTTPSASESGQDTTPSASESGQDTTPLTSESGQDTTPSTSEGDQDTTPYTTPLMSENDIL